MKTPIYYGGQSWSGVNWSPKLDKMVGLRYVDGDLIIEEWDTAQGPSTRQTISDLVTCGGDTAVIRQYIHLITP